MKQTSTSIGKCDHCFNHDALFRVVPAMPQAEPASVFFSAESKMGYVNNSPFRTSSFTTENWCIACIEDKRAKTKRV